jgi:hypothetical protein
VPRRLPACHYLALSSDDPPGAQYMANDLLGFALPIRLV